MVILMSEQKLGSYNSHAKSVEEEEQFGHACMTKSNSVGELPGTRGLKLNEAAQKFARC